MKTGSLVAALLSLALHGSARAASIQIYFDLPGVGTNLPVESFDWGITDIATIASGSGSQRARVDVFDLLRVTDGYSPQLYSAVVSGTPFASAALRLYRPLISTTVPYLSFDFENLVASAYSTPGSWNPSVPAENVTFNYAKVTAHYVPNPSNPWGQVMPTFWPQVTNADGTVNLDFLLTAEAPDLPGGISPDFAFTPDELRVTSPGDPNFLYVAAALEGPGSPLGEVLPPTLPVPEPSSFALLGVATLPLLVEKLRLLKAPRSRARSTPRADAPRPRT